VKTIPHIFVVSCEKFREIIKMAVENKRMTELIIKLRNLRVAKGKTPNMVNRPTALDTRNT